MTSPPRFRLAPAVHHLAEARGFCETLIGCREDRSANGWGDFDFHGHQIGANLTASSAEHKAHNGVDGEEVPVRHFGVILPPSAGRDRANRLGDNGMPFVLEPQIRSGDRNSEQSRVFVNDPIGNTLKFKAFADDAMDFAP